MTGKNHIGSTLFALITLLLCAALGPTSRGHVLDQSDDDALLAYPDYEQRSMSKRSALLLDRMFVALQKALENDELEKGGYKSYVRSVPNSGMSDSVGLSDGKTMDLQRRGQQKARVYWRCYFNAVTCFRRK